LTEPKKELIYLYLNLKIHHQHLNFFKKFKKLKYFQTPMTREFIQGPLNIQLPAIQLPSGLQNLVGQFTASGDEGGGGANQQQYSLQRQTSLVCF
jgi:hypothetical protein